jgi:hypothetical protein
MWVAREIGSTLESFAEGTLAILLIHVEVL